MLEEAMHDPHGLRANVLTANDVCLCQVEGKKPTFPFPDLLPKMSY